MKIAESGSERKESTKESQGEVFSGTMGHRPKTMAISKDYEETMKRQSTIIDHNQRQ